MNLSRENDPFAVSTPAPSPGGANLSPQERQLYEFMWQHRDRIPSLGHLISRNVLRWLIFGAGLSAMVVVFVVVEAATGSLDQTGESFNVGFLIPAAVGVFFGVLLRDWGQFQAVQKLWPLEMAVIDWPRVERLLWGEGASNDLPPARRLADEAPLAAIPVDDPPAVRDLQP